MHSVSLNGINTFPFRNPSELLSFVKGKKKILIAVNAEKIMNAGDRLTCIINHNVGYPDGIGAVYALKKKGHKAGKIPGVELWLQLIQEYQGSSSFYFIGATNEVIEEVVNKLRRDFPGIKIKGYRNGYFTVAEESEVINELVTASPDVVFVAMGSPRQEYFMEQAMTTWPALYMGLGGSFDVYTGKVRRAPYLFRLLHAEWLFRLLREPVRFKRQLILAKFLYHLLLGKI